MTLHKLISAICFVCLAGIGTAADRGWDDRLARSLSDRLRAIDRELAEIGPKLNGLPKIPVHDQGGSGGFASLHYPGGSKTSPPSGFEVRWKNEALVDFVALVPARRYDAAGLDAQYGLPDEFTVELLDVEGRVVSTVARQRGARNHPVRQGHPFCYPVHPPAKAAGLRVVATGLQADSESEGGIVQAWAEAFVFETTRNAALGADVRMIGGNLPSSPWRWSPGFLVDGQTPLGLPEMPGPEHGNIGWISEGRASSAESASITLDLGETATVDGARLLPAKPPTSDLPSGFGFPRRIVVSVSTAGVSGPWTKAVARELRNPGHSPVLVSFEPIRARWIKIEAVDLWKAFDDYPAFFALSEVEVLADGANLAQGKPVSSPDGMSNVIASTGRIWSSAALCDGHGPDGRLVPVQEWLAALDERLRLETRIHELRLEGSRLVAGWRRAGLAALGVLGCTGLVLAVLLPVRYRRHARHELVKVRERIAGDLHDEVGSNLGSIQMFADLAAGRSGPSEELKRIQRIAGETVSAVRDIVWLLRPEGDHRIGTVEHLRETSSIMLESLDWKFTANEAAWQFELPDDATRHLFLFFREALHNIIRHARANRVEIGVDAGPAGLTLTISDDGAGITPERLARPATLHALRQRSEALSAELKVEGGPGQGVRLILTVPPPRGWRRGTTHSNEDPGQA